MHPQKFAVNTGQFFWAGHDTTSSTLTWCLFELAADPATQVITRFSLQSCLQFELTLQLRYTPNLQLCLQFAMEVSNCDI